MPRSAPPRKQSARAARRRTVARMLTPVQVAAAVRALAAPAGTTRFAAGKALSVTAEKDPARVYPHFDALAALLNSDNKIVRWNALQILAALAPVDADRKLNSVVAAFIEMIHGRNLISAANAVHGLGRIALAHPDLRGRIVPALLDVEQATYATPECRNVAIGSVLDGVHTLGPDVCRWPDVDAFIRRQRTNPRPAVARRAERMLAGRG